MWLHANKLKVQSLGHNFSCAYRVHLYKPLIIQSFDRSQTHLQPDFSVYSCTCAQSCIFKCWGILSFWYCIHVYKLQIFARSQTDQQPDFFQYFRKCVQSQIFKFWGITFLVWTARIGCCCCCLRYVIIWYVWSWTKVSIDLYTHLTHALSEFCAYLPRVGKSLNFALNSSSADSWSIPSPCINVRLGLRLPCKHPCQH